jgi:hypothetical protein
MFKHKYKRFALTFSGDRHFDAGDLTELIHDLDDIAMLDSAIGIENDNEILIWF